MEYTKNQKLAILGLLALSLITRFAFFGTPNGAVFDEVHFGKFISSYFTHEYYFDIHPPLGKLILAEWGWLWGFQPGFSFANIGEIYPDNLYLVLRFLPTLAGALLPLVLYGLARQLRISHRGAMLAGVLIALDNALLTQSRFILLDSFLLLFGFGALWCYFHARSSELSTIDHRRSAFWLGAAGLLGGAAMSIKWTGATFLALIIVLELIHIWNARHNLALRDKLQAIGCLIVVPLLLYTTVFALHFALLKKSGTGDAFMSTRFQGALSDGRYASDPSLRPIGFFEKTIELNTEMYRSNQRLTATHPYASKWYTWPLMARPIFYWVKNTARIYLLGNPIVWWLSTAAILATIFTVLSSRFHTAPREPLIMIGAWAVNLLPFIGISRVMFLYHYLTALIWAILMLGYLTDQVSHPRKAVLAIGGLALAMFLFFAPLSYGLPLSDRAYNARVWFSSWR